MSTWSLTLTATNSPSRISAAISLFGRLSWKLASATETSSGLSVRMCATLGGRSWSVKREKNSPRVKTAVLARFYAGPTSRIDLLAGESREFRFASDLGLLVLNPVTPGAVLSIGRLILPKTVFPAATPRRCNSCPIQLSAVLWPPGPSLDDFPNFQFTIREQCMRRARNLFRLALEFFFREWVSRSLRPSFRDCLFRVS
jgi:hypothetical protein